MAGAHLIDLQKAKNMINDLENTKCNDIINWWQIRLIEREVTRMYWTQPALTERDSHIDKLYETISSRQF